MHTLWQQIINPPTLEVVDEVMDDSPADVAAA